MVSLRGRRGFDVSSWANIYGMFGLISSHSSLLCRSDQLQSCLLPILLGSAWTTNTGNPCAGSRLIRAVMMMIILAALSMHDTDTFSYLELLQLICKASVVITLQGFWLFACPLYCPLPALPSYCSALYHRCPCQQQPSRQLQSIRGACVTLRGEEVRIQVFFLTLCPALGSIPFAAASPSALQDAYSCLASISYTTSFLGSPPASLCPFVSSALTTSEQPIL